MIGRGQRAALADGLVALARIAAYRDRVILLSTAVVLREPGTTPTLAKRISAWHGPTEAKAGVLRMLEFLDPRPVLGTPKKGAARTRT